MRALTFKGFLARYVKELSREDTLDIKLLAADAASGGYRLRAPLVLYAVVSGKSARLAEAFEGIDGSPTLLEMLGCLTTENVEELLRNDELPEEYQKVWNAYQVALKTPERDNALKDAIRKKGAGCPGKESLHQLPYLYGSEAQSWQRERLAEKREWGQGQLSYCRTGFGLCNEFLMLIQKIQKRARSLLDLAEG